MNCLALGRLLRSAGSNWLTQPWRSLSFLLVLSLAMALYAVAAASAENLRQWYEEQRVLNGHWPALKVELQPHRKQAAGTAPGLSLERLLAPVRDWSGVLAVVGIPMGTTQLHIPGKSHPLAVEVQALPWTPMRQKAGDAPSCWSSAPLTARLAGQGGRLLRWSAGGHCYWQGPLPPGILPPDPLQAPRLYIHRLDLDALLGMVPVRRAYVVMDTEADAVALRGMLERLMRSAGVDSQAWQIVVDATPWMGLDATMSRSFFAGNRRLILVGQFIGTGLAVWVFYAGLMRLRLPELGLRRAFGARVGDLYRLMLAEALLMSFLAAGLGLVLSFAAIALAQWWSGEAWGFPLGELLGNALGLIGMMWLLSCWPAYRALQVPPYVALKA